MSPLFYIINMLLTLCVYLVILRVWMQYTRVNYYNPCTQFVIKITQPVIGPLRKLIPSLGKIDTVTILILYILAVIKFIVIMKMNDNNAAYFKPQYLMSGLYVILYSLGNLIFWMLLARAILSWISRGKSVLEEVLYQLTEPLIAPIRRFVPPIGNIDLSFMIFVFILIILNMVFMSLFSPWWGIISLSR
ncbi:YggT family protein [Orbus wheelerorum]|uniref:YggT family protein n=1 Tax=Orbus wheelerorum TaxID=3074111 RepID=UPI00370D026E